MVLQIPRRCICLSTVLAGMMRPSLQCCRAPSLDGWLVSPMHCSPVTRGRPGVKWAKGRDPAPAQNILQVKCLYCRCRKCLQFSASLPTSRCSLYVHCRTLLHTVVHCTIVHCMMPLSLSCVLQQQRYCSKRNSCLVSQSVAHLTWSGQGESAQN